jgi:hypothetical protein
MEPPIVRVEKLDYARFSTDRVWLEETTERFPFKRAWSLDVRRGPWYAARLKRAKRKLISAWLSVLDVEGPVLVRCRGWGE